MIYFNGKKYVSCKTISSITPETVEVYPDTLTLEENPDYKGSIIEGVSGMSKYFYETKGDYHFLAFRNNINSDIGFTIDLGDIKKVWKLQLRGWGDYRETELRISTSADGNSFDDIESITYNKNGEQVAYQINIDDDVRYIRVLQPLSGGGMAYRFIYRSVEVFAPAYNVRYKEVE